jgi:hypothetical protein
VDARRECAFLADRQDFLTIQAEIALRCQVFDSWIAVLFAFAHLFSVLSEFK